jgi:hypothetical protein
MLEHIPTLVTNEESEKPMEVIQIEELQKVILDFNLDKAPRPNVFTISFYRSH